MMGTQIKAVANAATVGSFAGDAIVNARVHSRFTHHQLKPFLSVGKRQDLPALADLLATGQITPAIDRADPLDKAVDALRYIAAGHPRGNVAITS